MKYKHKTPGINQSYFRFWTNSCQSNLLVPWYLVPRPCNFDYVFFLEAHDHHAIFCFKLTIFCIILTNFELFSLLSLSLPKLNVLTDCCKCHLFFNPTCQSVPNFDSQVDRVIYLSNSAGGQQFGILAFISLSLKKQVRKSILKLMSS